MAHCSFCQTLVASSCTAACNCILCVLFLLLQHRLDLKNNSMAINKCHKKKCVNNYTVYQLLSYHTQRGFQMLRIKLTTNSNVRHECKTFEFFGGLWTGHNFFFLFWNVLQFRKQVSLVHNDFCLSWRQVKARYLQTQLLLVQVFCF